MTTLQMPAGTRRPMREPTGNRTLLVWVDDEALLEADVRLDAGQVLPLLVKPIGPALRRDFDQNPHLARVRMQLDVDSLTRTDRSTSATIMRAITGIAALTATYLLHPGGRYLPDHRRAQLTPVPSTGGVVSGRNIWPPSGAPVHLGFLLHCDPVDPATQRRVEASTRAKP